MAKERRDVVCLEQRSSPAAAAGRVVDVEQIHTGRGGEHLQLRNGMRRQPGRRPAADVVRSHGEHEHEHELVVEFVNALQRLL